MRVGACDELLVCEGVDDGVLVPEGLRVCVGEPVEPCEGVTETVAA